MIQYNMHKYVPVHIDIYIYTYIQIVWEIFATLDNPNFMYDNYMYECMCVCVLICDMCLCLATPKRIIHPMTLVLQVDL